MQSWARVALTGGLALLLCAGPGSCGAGHHSGSTLGTVVFDICGCTPNRPANEDYRHAEKHIPIPSTPPIQTSVSDMLGWPTFPVPDGTPRSGRELQVFEIQTAYVQWVGMNSGDCDIHVELSQTADKKAPRVIVEIPGEVPADNEYCPARQNLQTGLAEHGVNITTTGLEVNPPLPADVIGLAFQDFEHNRGTQFVATTWELHPAIVTLH